MLSRFFNILGKKKGGEASPGPGWDESGEGATSTQAGEGGGEGRLVSPNWQPGEVALGRYRIERSLSGAMGTVYIADHLGWGAKIAIKSPRPEVLAGKEGVRRIMTEAEVWTRISMHPNIAYCYYVLSLAGVPHLFIEYVDGGSLEDWIKAGRCSDLRTALSLAIQVCHGLEYTHSQGIIHRDVKPQNILVTKDALVKITDFGILRFAADHTVTDPNRQELPAAGTESEMTVGFRGTPGFASPEQWKNAHAVDKRSDIFSFGLCLWLMLCGKKPFINNAVPHPIPEPQPVKAKLAFPPVLQALLKRCVAFAPDDRFPDFAALRHDLNEAYQESFQVPCPFNALEGVDLRADGLNNRGVSRIELGRLEEAEECFVQALEINDLLPEAIFNLLLFRVQAGRMKPGRALRHIAAVRKRLTGRMAILEGLEQSLSNLPDSGPELEAARLRGIAEFRLCQPVKTLDVYRESQVLSSVKRGIFDHLANKRYAAGQQALLTSWKNVDFKKDSDFARAYRQLLDTGKKEALAGVQRLRTIARHRGPVRCVTFTSDGQAMISAGQDGMILLQDLSSVRGKLRKLGSGGGGPVLALAMSPGGKRLVTGTENGFVSLWSLESQECLSATKIHDGAVTSLAFSRDGLLLASGGGDGMLVVRDFAAGRVRKIPVGEGGAICSLAFLPKTNDLFTGSADGSIRFWDTAGADCTRIIKAHTLPVASLSVSADGKLMASGSADRTAKVWECHSGRCLKTLEGHDGGVTSALVLPDSGHVATGCEDDLVKIWHAGSGECLQTLDGRGEGVRSLASGPQEHIFVSGLEDGTIVFWMLIYALEY